MAFLCFHGNNRFYQRCQHVLPTSELNGFWFHHLYGRTLAAHQPFAEDLRQARLQAFLVDQLMCCIAQCFAQ